MASLNLSINGPSIKSSYQGVVNGQLPSSSSPTFAQWALFSVQAPLLNAFQDSGSKESVLKVESKGDGELSELLEDLNEGRIQFAFVKVKDTNSGLPKNVLIAWCGGGVPERTKGYFTSHLAAVSKVLHGYHVQITARSDADLSPESIIQKVADASGAKYTAGGSAPSPASAGGPPPVAKKPVFTPKTSSGAGSFNPLVEARRRKDEEVDADGWGADAPPVNRTEIQRVESAYKPTKVNMAELVKQKQEPSRFNGGSAAQDDRPEVVRGAYQPVGKVDIAAIRAAAKEKPDDRPTVVKGAYEPVGKVDIAAIRAKAQKPAADDSEDRPKTLSERSSAFSAPQSERLASLPKPKVANKFAGASSFTGTKAPVPGAFGLASPSVSVPAPPPVGAASRTFADQGGKTPAQLWAEKKGKQGITPTSTGAPAPGPASPVAAQKSGGSGWQSGYQGKSWGTVQTTNFGRGGAAVVEQRTGGDGQEPEREQEKPESPAGVSSIRDRFKEAPPMGSAAASAPKAPGGGDRSVDEPAPPPNMSNRPAAPAGGFALPGLPQRPPEPEEEEEPERSPSPPRVAIPVPRGPEPEIEPPAPEPTIPAREIERALPKEEELEEELEEAHDTQARTAATAVAEQQFGQAQVAAGQPSTGGGKRALIQYDYEAAEDNEIELVDGQYVTDIEMVDEDWWMGTNSRGERGLFPSNYVELVEDDDAGAAAPPPPASAPTQAQAPAAAAATAPAPAAPAAAQAQAAKGPTATALYDYEAAEDNELSFPEGAKVMSLEFPDEDWWFGHFQGKSGLFPANYVELDQ